MEDHRHLFQSFGDTHRGAVRELNEDRFLCADEAGLWAVADGMGGGDAGDYASTLVIDSLHEITTSRLASMARAVRARLRDAHQCLRKEALARGHRVTIGSTVVVLLSDGADYLILWVGDSRVYDFDGQTLRQRSRDHSLVQEMVDTGQLTSEQARDHPRANIITRAIGAAGDLRVDEVGGAITPEQTFLLCSDGITHACAPPVISQALQAATPERAVQTLMTHALQARARDNITAVVVRPKG